MATSSWAGGSAVKSSGTHTKAGSALPTMTVVTCSEDEEEGRMGLEGRLAHIKA